MKKRIGVGILILVICVSLLIVYTAANNYTDLSKFDIPDQKLTKKKKKYMEKLLEKRGKDRKDIINGFAIEESKYYKIEINNLDKLLKGEGTKIDTEVTKSIVKNAIVPYMNTLPLHSVLPVVYVSLDGKEVLFCYKEADGTNVMKCSIYENNTWIHNEMKKSGEKPAKIEIEQ